MEVILKAILVSGTHGNEWTGIHLLSLYEKDSFYSNRLLANPKAYELNRRYVDEDLNRCFSAEKLAQPGAVYERHRAQEVLKEIQGFDVVVDLHTTTSNMGPTVIFSKKTKEVFLGLSYISQKLPEVKFLFNPDEDSQYLISHAPLGFVIEVGPIANSTLKAKVFEQTRQIVDAIKEAMMAEKTKPLSEIEFYEYFQKIEYYFNQEGQLDSMVSEEWQERDFKEIGTKEAFLQKRDGEKIYFEGFQGKYPIFINEAAYYNYKYAMQIVEKKTWKLSDAD